MITSLLQKFLQLVYHAMYLLAVSDRLNFVVIKRVFTFKANLYSS